MRCSGMDALQRPDLKARTNCLVRHPVARTLRSRRWSYRRCMRRFAQAIASPSSLPNGLPRAVTQALAEAPDRYNIGKGKPAVVLARDTEGQLVVSDMRWGLVPRWSKEPATPYTTVTARLDRAAASRIFAQAWKQRPCVVALSGYYKWDRRRKPPWPRFIQRRDGLALLAAGVWERWEGADGQVLEGFSLLTSANPAIPMPLTQDGPVFVEPDAALDWLAGALTTPAALARRAHTAPLESYPVGKGIGDPERDDYTLLEPVDPDAVAEQELAPREHDDWEDDDPDA